ncbi:anthranilate synthase component I family protein [Roseivirga sp. UBA1976]|uniref:anthranilate synthase component I family protein n=1 Tax=Roseivirga sp. UBA1976 TaxID=1947386 RepID=UPI00257B8E7E|nr:anthranilate synthase component I family protein [Roseivirga sp. UBA1976]
MTYFIPYRDRNRQQWTEDCLRWANQFAYFSYHQNNGIAYPHDGFRHVLAVGSKSVFGTKNNYFEQLRHLAPGRWLFGFIGYDLKNEIEDLQSHNTDRLAFEPLAFFEPEHLIFFEDDGLRIVSEQPSLTEEIALTDKIDSASIFTSPQASITREQYIDTVDRLRQHIEEGDCYEINFCQEFHGTVQNWNPVDTYLRLNTISPKPFSCLQKFNHQFIVCASPERFLKKEGTKIISQPIKGTRPRSANTTEDQLLKEQLRTSEKEIAENMMIVDLVRNDLARTSKPGTVKVEELFGLYSFEQVHQMISTVVAELRSDVDSIDAIKHAFPMGSMTGAPKVKVMQLIEQYENTKRGAFSGAAGYIEPNGDFDFNVLIRSLFVNAQSGVYSFQVGSAITYDADSASEYEECLLKASALHRILKGE